MQLTETRRHGPAVADPSSIGVETAVGAATRGDGNHAAVRTGGADLPEEATPNLGRQFFQRRSLIGLLVVVIALVAVVRQWYDLNWGDVWTQIRAADPPLLALACAVFYLTLPVRALRWRGLLANVGYTRAAGQRMPGVVGLSSILFQSWFVNCVTVARLGDVYRGWLLKRAAGVSLATTVGTVVADRLLDLAVLAVILVAATPFAFGGQIPAVVWQAAAVVLALVVLAGAALVGLRQARALVERLIPARFRGGYVRLVEGTAVSFSGGLPRLVGLSTLGWVIEAVSVYLVTVAVGEPITVAAAMVVALVGSVLTAIPITPSGLGLTEAGLILLLGRLGLDAGTASAVTLLIRLINYWSIVAFGLVLYLVQRWRVAAPATAGTA